MLLLLPQDIVVLLISDYLTIRSVLRLAKTCCYLHNMIKGDETQHSTKHIWEHIYKRELSQIRMPTRRTYREAYDEMFLIENELQGFMPVWFTHGYEKEIYRRYNKSSPSCDDRYMLSFGLEEIVTRGYEDLYDFFYSRGARLRVCQELPDTFWTNYVSMVERFHKDHPQRDRIPYIISMIRLGLSS
jgi:hypothetical protein